MARTIILNPGVTAATSTDVVVASGQQVTLAIYSEEAGELPYGASFLVTQETPGADNGVCALNNHSRAAVITGVGTYKVHRTAYVGDAFGVFAE